VATGKIPGIWLAARMLKGKTQNPAKATTIGNAGSVEQHKVAVGTTEGNAELQSFAYYGQLDGMRARACV